MDRKRFGTSKVTRRFNATMARIVPYAAASGAALFLWHAARDKPAANTAAVAPLVFSAAAVPAALVTAAVPPQDETSTVKPAGVASIQVVVGRNDTMDSIFRRMALDKADLAAIRNLPGIRPSLDFLKPADVIEVTHTNDGEIRELSRKVSETETLTVVREDNGFAAKMNSIPVEKRARTATATIDSSLFQAASSSAISDAVALKLAGVFAWDIDFLLDIRGGDRFTVVYEQIFQNGKYLHDGDVLAAEFINDGKVYRAVRFVPEGGPAGYFTPDGRPMRKPFLRAPVDFTRVSSVFDPARMHPILNRIRGHMGTDYAAPTGTPIHAAGDGRVSFEGTRGGYGNAVTLLHSNGVSTLYGHMSRFARNIRVGKHVSQGDIIGYVGMTGLATGPHLHYEYLMNGVHMNPQTVRLPGAEPLRAEAIGQFRSAIAPLLSSLLTPTSASLQSASTQSVSTRAVAAPIASASSVAHTSALAVAAMTEPRTLSDTRSKTSVN